MVKSYTHFSYNGHAPGSLSMILWVWLQGRRGNQAGWAECGRNEAAKRAVGEVCLPGRGQPYDEAHYQLSVQEQGGVVIDGKGGVVRRWACLEGLV